MANCWTSGLVWAGSVPLGRRRPLTGLYESFDDQMSPSKVSSEVSRQYAFWSLLTVKTSTPVWFTNRPRMVTNGLMVDRELGPLRSLFRQATSASLRAPGGWGPKTRAAITAAAPRASPGRATVNQPPGVRLANQ